MNVLHQDVFVICMLECRYIEHFKKSLQPPRRSPCKKQLLHNMHYLTVRIIFLIVKIHICQENIYVCLTRAEYIR